MKPFVPVDSVLVASSWLAGCFAYVGGRAGRSGRENAQRLRGASHPADQLREHGRHSQVQTVFATCSRAAEPERVDDSRRALRIFNHRKEKTHMNPNPTTFDVPTGLSNLLSAYDDAHWKLRSSN